jgi:hypothetical protein
MPFQQLHQCLWTSAKLHRKMQEYVYSNNTTGMVYATKENCEKIDRVASRT